MKRDRGRRRARCLRMILQLIGLVDDEVADEQGVGRLEHLGKRGHALVLQRALQHYRVKAFLRPQQRCARQVREVRATDLPAIAMTGGAVTGIQLFTLFDQGRRGSRRRWQQRARRVRLRSG